MSKKTWIVLGAVLGAMVMACGGIFYMLVLPKVKQGIAYTSTMYEYSARTRTLEEANQFSSGLDGGGSIALTEIGVRRGSKIEVWKEATGWKTVGDEKVDPGFEINYGYIKGVVKGRDFSHYKVYSELGLSKMQPNGEFVIDIDNLRVNDINLFFGDEPFEKMGEWKPGSRAEGAWSVNKEFKLGAVTDVAPQTELWPFSKDVGMKLPDVTTAKGLLIHTDPARLDPIDRQVEFKLKSGDTNVSKGFTFYDDRGEVWWIFPYEGNLKDVVQADYLGRPVHYIYLLDVDFF